MSLGLLFRLFALNLTIFCNLGFAENQQIQSCPRSCLGVLGKTLGTRMVIGGTRAKVLLSNPLEVVEIDSNPLKSGISIEIRGKIELQEGKRYQLEGYESAEFSGSPSWLAPAVQQPFQYRSFFVVSKVMRID